MASRRLGFTELEGGSILEHLIRGNDLTAWGLANAVTRATQDVESYDREAELEATGGRVIELPPTEWAEIAAAGETSSRRQRIAGQV